MKEKKYGGFVHHVIGGRTAVVAGMISLLAFSAALRAQGLEPDFPGDSGDGPGEMIKYLSMEAVPRWWLTFAAMFAAALLVAVFGPGRGRPKQGAAGDEKGPQLPPSLRSVHVLGKTYALDTYSGQVTDEKTWSETDVHVSHTVSGPGTPESSWPTTSQVSVTTTTTKKDRVWLRYPDGGEGAWHFTNGQLAVARGQLVSLVTRGTKQGNHDCLIGYNHNSGQFDTFNFRAAHAIPQLWTWLGATAVGTLGAAWGWTAAIESFMAQFAPGMPATPMDTYVWIVAFCAAAIVALVPYFVALLAIPGIRTLQFRTRYLPGIRQFLQSSTPELRQQLGQ